ncbi:MAG: Rab family GTPase [Ahrensia sp.]
MAEKPLKILFLGAMAVGKSSIIKRLTVGEFDGDYKSTLGVQLHELSWPVDGKPRQIVLWDTDGDAEAGIVSSPYARGADAAMLVCDVERPRTAETLIELAEAMQDYLPGRPYIGVINKTDLKQPSHDMVERVEDECDYISLTSALDGRGLQDALTSLIRLIDARGEG